MRLLNILAKIVRKFNTYIMYYNKNTHQLNNSTSSDRYPEIFNSVKAQINENHKELKILSFGCSTGEECFALRNYFKNAKIIGVDINTANLKKCTAKNRDNNTVFFKSSLDNIINNGKYDVIFAMSVLCRWPETKDCKNIERKYPFSKFQEVVCMLNKSLKNRGLLVVFNSNYLVMDTTIHNEYETINIPIRENLEFVHKFDKNGNRLKECEKNIFVLYKKIA